MLSVQNLFDLKYTCNLETEIDGVVEIVRGWKFRGYLINGRIRANWMCGKCL